MLPIKMKSMVYTIYPVGQLAIAIQLYVLCGVVLCYVIWCNILKE